MNFFSTNVNFFACSSIIDVAAWPFQIQAHADRSVRFQIQYIRQIITLLVKNNPVSDDDANIRKNNAFKVAVEKARNVINTMDSGKRHDGMTAKDKP